MSTEHAPRVQSVHDHLSRQEGSGMTPIDLHAVAERFHKALEAKPSKGPITEKGIAAITDSVADVPELLAELERLTRWKAEALPVMAGLQELGRALGLPLGARITGPMALAEVERLKARMAELAQLRAELAEHPGTAWDSAIRLRDRVLAALEANDTGVTPDGSGLPSDERNRFSDDETGSRA